jgi:hypothetical protein
MLVLLRFASAFDAEIFVTTENEAIEDSSLNSEPASLPASGRPHAAAAGD